MVRRPLGRTGLSVSPIGFGAFKIGRNQKTKYPGHYELPDADAVAKLLHAVLDCGINYIDTAPAYGLSEERIGETIGRRRGEFVLSTKVGEIFEDGRSRYDFSQVAVRASIEQSLRRLRTDVVDLVFVHAPGDDVRVLRETPVVETLLELRDRGLVRFVGLSGKTIEAERAALEWADVLMVEYHARDRSHEPVLDEAAERGVGVVVKKGLASGHLPAEEAIPFVLRHPAVASLVVGSLSAEHMRQNLRIAERALARPRCRGTKL